MLADILIAAGIGATMGVSVALVVNLVWYWGR